MANPTALAFEVNNMSIITQPTGSLTQQKKRAASIDVEYFVVQFIISVTNIDSFLVYDGEKFQQAEGMTPVSNGQPTIIHIERGLTIAGTRITA